MKPILYEANETEFNTNGLGRLVDAISCKVTEERNGLYELAMEYPQSGIHCADLAEGRLIYAVPFDGGRKQIFRIYYVSEPLNGIVTVNAEHISYLLNKMVVMPFSAGSAAEVFAKIPQYAVGDCPFTFSTNKEVVANFNLSNPKEIRRILGGEAGSILDVYGKGEYEFDNFTVILHTNRGTNSGVTLRYGKNITELQRITDSTDTYVGIVPFWADDTQTITLPEKVVYAAGHENDYAYKSVITVDFSSEFENAPTIEQLRARANRYLTANEGWTIKQTIKVSFVALWNTEEYKNVAPLERVHLCDTVNIFIKKFNINATAKVVKTVYDVLLERYDSIELGDASTSLSKTIQEQYIEPAIKQSTSHMDKAISHATRLIQGGLGGHVVMKSNANGEPEEILIMDTDDVETAVNVLRINMNGIGFSSTGYNGPFKSAWTLDGHFVADFIDTGTLVANLVKAGILSDEKGLNYWNMETGEFHLSANSTVGNSGIASQSQITELDGKITTTAESLTTNFSKEITILQDQIDDNIETFTGSAVPSINNYPAVGWETDATKDSHIGDLYVVNSSGGGYAGFYYRFEKVNNTYQWTLLKDTEITKALADAAAAQAKADAVGDDLSQNYSTTIEMRSEISQTAEGLNIEILKKVDNAEFETKFVATAETVSVRTDKLSLLSSGVAILENGDFELGGRGEDAALSYERTSKSIKVRDGLSLTLNGISLMGDRYRFDNNGVYKYNEISGNWDDVSISTDVLSQITFDATGSYYVYVTQFPNMTILEAKFSITASGTGTILLSHVLPPHALPMSAVTNRVPITFHNATNWQVASGLNYGNVAQVYSNVTGGVRLRASNIETLGTLSGSSSGKQYITDTIVYPSYSYPLNKLLENGHVDVV